MCRIRRLDQREHEMYPRNRKNQVIHDQIFGSVINQSINSANYANDL